MWNLEIFSQKIVLALLLASSLGTAAFAFNTTVYAKAEGCCMIVASCMGDPCFTKDACSSGYCCSSCG